MNPKLGDTFQSNHRTELMETKDFRFELTETYEQGRVVFVIKKLIEGLMKNNGWVI